VECKQDDGELIPFSNAASRVYAELTGDYLSPFGNSAALLHDVAQAMVKVVTIYGARGNESIKPLSALDLQHGTFQRAATIVRTSSGIEYRRLYVRRGDVRAAVTAFKRSGQALN
jgi:hypothetical protein